MGSNRTQWSDWGVGPGINKSSQSEETRGGSQSVAQSSAQQSIEFSAAKLSQLIGGILAQSNLSHGGIVYETPYGQRKIGDHLCDISPAIQESCDLLIKQGNHPAIALAVAHHTPFDLLRCVSNEKTFRHAHVFFAALRSAGFQQMYFLPLQDKQGQIYLASTACRERRLSDYEIRLIHSYCLEALDQLSASESKCKPEYSRNLLTPRERECLIAAAKGYTEKLTARRLGISPNTVHVHLENSKRKLGARNKLNAIILGLKLREILDADIITDD